MVKFFKRWVRPAREIRGLTLINLSQSTAHSIKEILGMEFDPEHDYRFTVSKPKPKSGQE